MNEYYDNPTLHVAQESLRQAMCWPSAVEMVPERWMRRYMNALCSASE
jgi:hypothetical protein